MKWLNENWSLLVVLAVLIILIARFIKKFSELPSDEQMEKIRQWMLFAVIQAEKELGGGTGQVKLRYVYDLFLERFQSLAPAITFVMLSDMVDEALEKMRHLLETNSKVKEYIEEGKNE